MPTERCFIAKFIYFSTSQTKHRSRPSLLAGLAEDFLFVRLETDGLSLAGLMPEKRGGPVQELLVVVEVAECVCGKLLKGSLILMK